MSTALTGALFGAGLGFVSFVVLRFAADKIEQSRGEEGSDPKRVAYAIRLTALMDLMLFPVMGYFIGPMVFDA